MVLAGVMGAFILTGCKIDVETKIPLSGLMSEGIKTSSANLLVEVAACNDHKDSRNPSDMLIKVRDAVAKAFPVAVYKECFRKEFNSYANFEVPANYGQGSDAEWGATKGVRIMARRAKDGTFNVSSGLPQDVRKVLDASSKEKYKIEAFKVENVRMHIALGNDMGQDMEIFPFGTFVQNTPVVGAKLNMQKGGTYNFRLSDVTTAAAFHVGLGPVEGATFLTISPVN